MITRRLRNAKHGLEKRGKPILLPLVALLLAVAVWSKDHVAAGGSTLNRALSVQANGSETSGGHSVAAPFNVAARQNDSLQGQTTGAPSSDGNNPSAVAATPLPRPVQGITRKGDAFVLTRFSKGPLQEFTVKFSHPNTMVDR